MEICKWIGLKNTVEEIVIDESAKVSLKIEHTELSNNGEDTLEEARMDCHGRMGVIIGHQDQGGQGGEPVLCLLPQPGWVG